MQFGQTNATLSFQEIMYVIVKNIKACIWYLNDILICGGNTKAEHHAIVEKMLGQYMKHDLVVYLLKSEFHVHVSIFLEYVISGQEVKMDHWKLKTFSK